MFVLIKSERHNGWYVVKCAIECFFLLLLKKVTIESTEAEKTTNQIKHREEQSNKKESMESQ